MSWDEAYRTGRYREFWELAGAAPELIGFLTGQPPGGGRPALDVGCGTGRDAVALARSGYRVSAVDVSAEAIALARKRAAEAGLELDLRVADAGALPFADASFALVTDRGCLHHLAGDDRDRYAVEVARVLRPGGLLFLRGCREARFPFTPVTEAELVDRLCPGRFTLARLLPVTLVTDAAPLAGNACLLRRLPTAGTESARHLPAGTSRPSASME